MGDPCVREAGEQRVAAGDGCGPGGLAGREGLGVSAALVGQDRHRVPHAHRRDRILRQPGQMQGPLVQRPGAGALAGVHARPGRGRGVVGREGEEPLPGALGGRLLLKRDGLLSAGERGPLQGVVAALGVVQQHESVEMLPQPQHVTAANPCRGRAEHRSTGRAGRQREEGTAVHGILHGRGLLATVGRSEPQGRHHQPADLLQRDPVLLLRPGRLTRTPLVHRDLRQLPPRPGLPRQLPYDGVQFLREHRRGPPLALHPGDERLVPYTCHPLTVEPSPAPPKVNEQSSR